MSILNGAISARRIHRESMPYGPLLRENISYEVPGCYDIAFSEDHNYLYAGGAGELIVYAVQAGCLTETGRLKDIGRTRQVACANGIVCVSAREDGVYIIDVHDPAVPRLVYHLDTLELATGICMDRNLCLITNRHMGVEIHDLSDPAHPVFLSSFPAGEAQSVCVDAGYAYTGDWMNRKVHIHNIKDPKNPVQTAEFMVDGYADGLFVRNGLCLAATGHHSGKLINRRAWYDYTYITPDMIESGYGSGSGLTLYDVSLPDEPEFLSEIKLPPLYAHPDTWRVVFSGTFAYVCDSRNGLFVIDISDPVAPAFAGYYTGPVERDLPAEPLVQTPRAPFTAFLPGDGVLYAAEPTQNRLILLDFPEASYTAPCAAPAAHVPSIRLQNVLRFPGQIHTVHALEDKLFASCGNDGVFLLNSQTMNPEKTIPVPGIAHDTACMNHCLYIAQGDLGISVRSIREDYKEISIWSEDGFSIRQLVADPLRNLLCAQAGCGRIVFLKVSPDGSLQKIGVSPFVGMLYHHHLCPDIHPSGYLVAAPLSTGICWMDLNNPADPVPLWQPPEQGCPLEDGVAVYRDQVCVIRSRQYTVIEKPEDTLTALLPENRVSVPGARLTGQAFVTGDLLTLINRANGWIEILSLEDPRHPRLVSAGKTPYHPEFAFMFRDQIYIACGHDGLFRVL